MPRWAFSLAIVVLLFSAAPAMAEPIESPMEQIYADGTMLIAGPLVEINPTGRIVIERKDVLSGKGKPPDRIDIRVSKDLLPRLKIGDKLIVAYTMLRPDPRHPMRLAVNPDGAIALDSPGMDPAVFSDTPGVRAILKAGSSEHGRESRKLLDLLLAALGGRDAEMQALAAGQLSYGREIDEKLRDADRDRIRDVASDAKTPPTVCSLLIEGASRQPKTLGDWWRKAALDVVTTTPVDGYADKASDPVGLVLTSLEVLDRYAVTVPPDALKRWVWNPNPPLVERACVMLRREAPDQERSTIQLALADPKLPGTTRKFLDDHLRRLDRLNQRKQARKAGAG